LAAATVLAAHAQDITGDWQGTLKPAPHISHTSGGSLNASMDSVDQSANGIPITAIACSEGRLAGAFDRWTSRCGSLAAGRWDGRFQYPSGHGQAFSSSIYEVVVELLSHGAHHRGQIALLLRQGGHEPPASTDFIPALRSARFI
jgi:hypothetical protein